ncbi:MAG TPA: hypothetical protein VJ783_23280 [Pirellulales bacterium]|nr:hypothetical protein [Pirellulales bacterium]
MKRFFTAAILVALTLWGHAAADEPPAMASAPQLIVAPNASGSELRIVEVGKPGSQSFTAGVSRPIFPSWRTKDRRLLFTSDASGRFQLYAMEDTGGVAQNLTNTSSNDDQPAWAPDGSKVLFTSDRDGNREIYVMDSDGRNQTNLTKNPGFDSDGAWSPDGKQIAFASDRSGMGFHLMVMNADGSKPRNLIDQNLGGMLYPCWSPDGQQIAFSGLVQNGELRLYVANSDGTGMQALTEEPGMSCYPAWSPDGRYLAYVHFARHPDQTPEGGRLMLFDIEEGTSRELADGAPRVTASRMGWRPEEK